MEHSYNSNTPKIVGALVITAVIASGAYVFLIKSESSAKLGVTQPTTSIKNTQTNESISPSSDGATSAANDTTSDSSTSSSSSTTSTASGVKDGTYTATASYYVPHGQNEISIKVTIKDGTIAAVSDDHNYADRESRMYIQDFDDSISGAVVGKKISSISLYRVGGASLTTEGFDAALSDVLKQAQA